MKNKLFPTFVAASRQSAANSRVQECGALPRRRYAAFLALVLLATLNPQLSTCFAQGTAFTYQGRFSDSGNAYTGNAEFQATLWSVPSSGTALATNSPPGVVVGVTNGLFVLPLDFGASPFAAGADRWLQLEVRTVIGPFTTLAPRQQLTPSPYAILAANATTATSVSGSVSAAQLTGTLSSNNIGAGSITTVMLASGAVGSNQLASGAVTTGALADGAVTAAKVATVSNWFALTIANPTPADSDNFGISVAAVGSDRVLIGAYFDDTGAVNAGTAYLFSTNGTLLTTFTNPTPAANDNFGISVAAVGSDRVLIGAYFDGTGATEAGAAYLFSIESYTPGLIADGVNARSITIASLEDGAVTAAKLDPTIGVWTRSGDNVFRLMGNVGIGTATPTNKLHVVGGVSATVFVTTSDRNAKENFSAVDVKAMLEKVAALPITQWNFKEDKATPHVGPMAQDFYSAFKVGPGSSSIATVDADGVALAAIQGLNQKVEQRSQDSGVRIQKLEAENAELKQRLEKLEQLMNGKNGGAK